MIHGSALYRGRVMHRRLRPKRHRLAYKLAMVLFDPVSYTHLTLPTILRV